MTATQALVAAGFISLLSITTVLFTILTSKKYPNTHFLLYFVALSIADLLQALGTILSLNWIVHGGVEEGSFCSAQGALEQAGNHVHHRRASLQPHVPALQNIENPSKTQSFAAVTFSWFLISLIVFLGPVAIQSVERGPYFGISGKWCWITHEYKREQGLLQYLLEGLSVILSSFLYISALLRVRGNLIKIDGSWTLRFVRAGDSWKLGLGRDFTDETSFKDFSSLCDLHMIWYAVAYTVLIAPIALVRISAFAGAESSFVMTVVADFIFSLGGIVDVLLFLSFHRILVETSGLPEFTARRKTLHSDVLQSGITPLIIDPPLPAHVASEKARPESMLSIGSVSSVDS